MLLLELLVSVNQICHLLLILLKRILTVCRLDVEVMLELLLASSAAFPWIFDALTIFQCASAACFL
jgi:hypothetical protein